MILLILSCNLTLSKVGLFFSSMDRRTRNATKEQSSISLSHEILDRQPGWSRCNSFSSSSNDSSVFCSNRHLQDSSFTLGKRNEATCPMPKRNRNSSGSSVSSNLSCVSDKDAKKTSVILSTNSIPSVGKAGIRSKVEELARLSCPEINTSTFELQHEALLNDRLSCPNPTNSVLPFRHNLRRNIRKKTCSCDCTATCTTLVVRRYKEIGKKTVEEETVISRTKVQTCVQNNATQEVHKVTYEKSYSPNKSDSNRKRRSEVEKLYDSLHEIEWAKNFSPDNILRQINIRQAASCSMFGRSSDKTSPSDSKPAKKQKANHEQATKSTFPRSPSENKKFKSPRTPRNTRSSTLRNCSRSRSNTNETTTEIEKHRISQNQTLPSTGEANLDKLSVLDSEPNLKNENPNEINLNDSTIQFHGMDENVEKLNVKKHIGVQNSSIDCKLKPNSTELINCNKSSRTKNNFETPVSIATLIPKNYHLNNIKSGPDVDFDISELASEYSLTPTFFDIAEEGIRTIDACFREVGAEVVISTCYEGDSDLPLLTSVKDTNLSDKVPPVNENPPVLEPCITIQDQIIAPKMEDMDSSKDCPFENGLSSGVSPCENIFIGTSSDVVLVNNVPKVKSNVAIDFDSSKYCSQKDSLSSKLSEISILGKVKVDLINNVTKVNSNATVDFESSNKCPQKKNLNSGVGQLESNLRKVKMESAKSPFQKEIEKNYSKVFKGMHKSGSQCVNDSLIKGTGKRILSKYLKILRTKTENASNEKVNKVTEKNGQSKRHFPMPTVNRNPSSENPIPKTGIPKSNILPVAPFSFNQGLNCRTTDLSTSGSTIVKTSDQRVFFCKSPEKITFNHSQSSYTFSDESRKPIGNLTTKSVTNKSLIVQEKNCNFFRIQHTSVATTHVPTRIEYTRMLPPVPDDSISNKTAIDVTRPKSFTFSCHYQTITVNRSNGYTQVILKLTHGTSSFLTVESLTELKEVVMRTGQDAHCHTLIINGIGNSFSLGLDLRPLLGPQKMKASANIAVLVKDFIKALSEFKKPIVAVVNGPAHGLGMTLLNHADTIIASVNATFCMPQSRLGYFPEGGATLTLPRAVGSTVAMDLIMTGRIITAQEARNIGLISEVFEEKNLPEDLIARVKVLAKNTLSSMETTKSMLKMHLHPELLTVLENEVKLLPQMWLSDSCQNALINAEKSGLLLHKG